MPSAHRLTWTAAAGLAAIVVGGCGSSSSSSGGGGTGGGASNLPSALTIGAPLDISGSASVASVGAPEQEGEQLAVDEINSSGFLGNTKLSLKVVDTQADKALAVQTLTDMTSRNKVDGIVGFTLSPSFLAAGPLAQKAQIPTITVDLSGTGITEVGDYIFRISPALQTLYQKNDVTIANALKAKTAAYIFSSDSSNTVGQKDFRKQLLEGAGIKTVAEQGVTAKDIDYQKQLTTIKSANPDVLVIDILGGQDPTLAKQVQQAGLTTNMMADVGWNSPGVLSQAGAACTIFSTVWDPSISTGRNQHFLTLYNQKFSKAPSQYSAWGYDGVWAYATAVKNAGAADGPSVQKQLAALTNFDGTLGNYGFGPDRAPTVPGLTLQISGGKAVPWTPTSTCTR